MTGLSSNAPKRKRYTLLAFALCLGGLGSVAYYQRSLLPARFAVVDEGRLYRSAQPSTQQIQHLIDTRGLKTILIVRSGTSSRVPDEIGFAHGKGLHVVHIPIESQKPIPQEQIEAFFRCVDDPGNAPILVHCSAGRHRTGYLCARYRIDRQGWPLERAIDELLSFGFDTQDQSAVLEQLKQYRPAAIRTTALSAASPGVRDDP